MPGSTVGPGVGEGSIFALGTLSLEVSTVTRPTSRPSPVVSTTVPFPGFVQVNANVPLLSATVVETRTSFSSSKLKTMPSIISPSIMSPVMSRQGSSMK